MPLAIVLILLVVATVLFHILSPWWFTPIASNWSMMDDTVKLTFWVTGVVFVAVNLFMAYAIVKFRHRKVAHRRDTHRGSRIVCRTGSSQNSSRHRRPAERPK